MKCLRNSSRLNSSLTFGYAKNFPKVVVFLPSAFIIHVWTEALNVAGVDPTSELKNPEKLYHKIWNE
ncbi:hypothetical protein CFP56_031634 [Quercus suber]|uniref:Uncharacterized protein n=1 Tax=Quercus suber TaxID=58331 RepID=A0AAW0JKW6_QUESU